MNERREPPQLGYGNGRRRGSSSGLLARVLQVAAGALVLIGAIAISIAVFAVVLAGALIAGGYLWWKTRHVRRQLQAAAAASRDQPSARPDFSGGDVIEGEVIRKEETTSPGRGTRT